ncbi:Protein transport protein sec39 [Talaromyces islandicus]|uniref:Protein transport protein sec39 n=1 Tax=Talaromyces islandicus TaxID=28573 RepID=A0A0U1M0Q4_TALIS|nr:Protein transport protein sec39 [Talaromyces islandicus]
MPTTNDKFIFVNAPTIINAGPRDARRQLRSQLMRRVYLRKYQEPPPRIEDVVDTIEQDPPKDDSEGESSSSRAPTTSPPVSSQQWPTEQVVSKPTSLVDSKLPTPPSEGDGDDGCSRCGGFCRSPGQCQPVVRIRKKAKLLSPANEAPLDLGPLLSSIAASAINPFAVPDNVHNAPNSQMLINHYALALIPALRSGKDWHAGVSTNYLRLLPDPIVFNTICLSASIHLDRSMIWNGVETEHVVRRSEQHYYRYNALRALRQVLAKSNPKVGTPEFDHVLVSICMLAINDLHGETSQGVVKRDYNPFSNPLPTLGALNVYGYRPIHYFHWSGLLTLLSQHGGFHSLSLFAARFKISYTAVKYALHTYTKPAFPICNHKGEILTGYSVLEVVGMTPSQLPPYTGEGFRNLETLMIRESIFRPFIELSQLAKAIPLLVPKCSDPITEDLIADARNLAQYRFQNLPLLTDDPLLVVDVAVHESIDAEDSLTRDIIHSTFAVYSLCWLVTYLFTTHVTFPVPSSRRFRLKIVFELESIMDRCESLAYNNLYVMRLQVWAAVIGGITAEDVDLGVRTCMALRLQDLCKKLGLGDWAAVSDVLNTFAWIEDACDHAGRNFWAEMGNMS